MMIIDSGLLFWVTLYFTLLPLTQARNQDYKFGVRAASVFGGRHISRTTILL